MTEDATKEFEDKICELQHQIDVMKEDHAKSVFELNEWHDEKVAELNKVIDRTNASANATIVMYHDRWAALVKYNAVLESQAAGEVAKAMAEYNKSQAIIAINLQRAMHGLS